MMPGRIKKCVLGFVAALAVSLLVFVVWIQGRYVVPILMYHQVTQSVEESQSLNNVPPEAFAQQMQYLKDHKYKVISFEEFVEGVKAGRNFARNSVVIQFDDGYEDNYTQAFPILRGHGFPAIVFIVSDKVGIPGYLTWKQIKEMDANGFTAGAHTRTHAYLPELTLEEAEDEIAGSKKTIEDRLGRSIDFFTYPVGGFTDQVQDIVKRAGFKAAATTNRGRDPLNRDLFELNRIRIKGSDKDFKLWAKLSGYYNVFRRPKCSAGGHCVKLD